MFCEGCAECEGFVTNSGSRVRQRRTSLIILLMRKTGNVPLPEGRLCNIAVIASPVFRRATLFEELRSSLTPLYSNFMRPPHYNYFWLEGIVGCAGLLPTVEAIKKRKTIALANKETLIAGGPAVLPLLKEYGVDMIPADSEHSAIFQCLQARLPL